jgi:hypothetical protein
VRLVHFCQARSAEPEWRAVCLALERQEAAEPILLPTLRMPLRQSHHCLMNNGSPASLVAWKTVRQVVEQTVARICLSASARVPESVAVSLSFPHQPESDLEMKTLAAGWRKRLRPDLRRWMDWMYSLLVVAGVFHRRGSRLPDR